MNFDFEYLTLADVPDEKRKTRLIEVRSKSHGFVLGIIKWYGPWRQYVFFPAEDTLYSVGCLADIQTAVTALMDERKQAK